MSSASASNLIVREWAGMPGRGRPPVAARLRRRPGAQGGYRERRRAAAPRQAGGRDGGGGQISAAWNFFFGIPGTIGGALRMNAGANGAETKDVLDRGYGRRPRRQESLTSPNAEMKFVYRKRLASILPSFFTSARLFAGRSHHPRRSDWRMNEGANPSRKTAQADPRKRPGDRPFKNPPGEERLEADRCPRVCRGLRVVWRAGVGNALQFSDQHGRCHRP